MKLGDDFRAALWRGLAFFCLVMVALSCKGDQGGELAQGCSINSDCNDPLVCAFKRCHSACSTTRDCSPGLRCVASDRPYHVCQLGEETKCVFNTDCPGGQVCAVDAQCRDRCKADSDCLGGQLCVSGSCAERTELRDGGLTVVPKDASTSSGQPCSYNSQCPDRLICRNNLCQVECLTSPDCSGGRQCVQNRCQVRVCPETDAGSGAICSFNSDCPAPLVCKSGSCTCECRFAGDCAAGYDCNANRCTLGGVRSVGADGGTLASADGRLTLVIPPGALPFPVSISIEVAEAWPEGALGPVFEVRPSGTLFAQPVTFVYRYQADDIAPVAAADVRLAVANGPAWNRLMSSVNAEMKTVTAQVTHLSTYGLVGPPQVDAGVDAALCTGTVCSGTVRDNCCPVGCTAASDSDCSGCGNGSPDPGETCDPPGSCPSSCDDQNDCTTDTQTGSAATCTLSCQHSAKTCSNAGNDRCCPMGCTAQNDSDCAACGDGVIDRTAGETCDPPGTCPTGCTAGQCWEITTLTGSAGTCNARCSTTQLPCSGNTSDGCCPPGCNTSPSNRDVDCAATCGNSVVDTGETCDPLSSCPMSCPQQGCTLRALSGGGTCQARCQTSGTQTACMNGDGCCPSSCNAVNDNDCTAVCGNGVLEAGELCEGTSCPTSCANQGCTVRVLQGTGCQRQCVNMGTVTACTAGDSCCPTNCSAANDADCSGCGNGRLEAGETCDPPGSCPSCDDQNSCTTDTATGSAATCNLVCSHSAKTCSNAGNDQCCPMGCNAQNDSDCAGCGDGFVDANAGETCDPPGTCPTACTPGQCWEVKTFTGSPATCNARCSTTLLPCSGLAQDGCCPPGCNTSPTNRDVDCPAMCGNNIVDTGETCDPLTSCPMSCPQQGCTLRSVANAGTCNAACQNSGTQTNCVNGDSCCPGGGAGPCNTTNDNDCLPFCGNGVTESGEICDGANCPMSCPMVGCTIRALVNGGTCQAQCQNTGTQNSCVNNDGCCPATGCNANTDNNCAAVCGNNVIEPGEICDGNCPASCPNIGCQKRKMQGTGCQAQCVNDLGDGGPEGGLISTCTNGDNCCPGNCNANNDNNCTPFCGNNVVEPPETCEPGLGNCPTFTGCTGMSNQNTIFTYSPGEAGACSASCTASPRPCQQDGWCPTMCNVNNDPDCLPAPPSNDRCSNAIDISNGGSFAVNINAATQQDTAEVCSAKGPEVFYAFDLKGPEFVYFSVLDNPVSGNVVPLAIELYDGGCPPPDGTGRAFGGGCDAGGRGEQACRRNQFPLVTSSGQGSLAGKPLNPGNYAVAVRAFGGTGNWVLTYHHVPQGCVAQGEIVPGTQLIFQQGNTCQTPSLDHVKPSCILVGEDGADHNFAVYKCPNQSLRFTTCDGRTVADTALSAVLGSMQLSGTTCTVTTGKEVACNRDIGLTVCDAKPNAAQITNVGTNEPGLLMINVDIQKGCGAYSLGSDYK